MSKQPAARKRPAAGKRAAARKPKAATKRAAGGNGDKTSGNGEPVAVSRNGPGEVGRRLRQLREERRLSLATVAKGTGLSSSFLSLVEQNKSDISIGRLSRLAGFFGSTVTDMMGDQPLRDPIVARAGETRELVSKREGITIHFFTPIGELKMMPYTSVFEPGGGTSEYAKHEGEEFFYVLEGEIILDLDGIGEFHLEEGDSVYFHADVPHQFRNPTEKTVRLIGAVTPSSL